jgi:hypothetical protein
MAVAAASVGFPSPACLSPPSCRWPRRVAVRMGLACALASWRAGEERGGGGAGARRE